MILPNIAAFTSLGVFVYIIYLFKEVIDKDRIKAKYPFVTHKLFRIGSGLNASCLLVIILYPQLMSYAILCFLGSSALGLFWIKRQVKKMDTFLSVHYVTIGVESFLTVPTDTYSESSKGIYTRRVNGVNDLKGDEIAHKAAVKEINFDKYIVLFTRFDKNGLFPMNKLNAVMTVTVLEGVVRLYNNNPVLREGQTEAILANRPHFFKGEEKGLALVIIEKSISH